MAKTKILILEDNTLQLDQLTGMLLDFGYDVVGTATSGEEVLQQFKETQPDLVLLDIIVQGDMDGIEAGKALMEIRQVPVIYLTAHDNQFKRALVTHPAAFFSKPYNERDLQIAIDLAVHNFAYKVRPADEKPEEFSTLANIYFSHDCLWVKTKSGEPFKRVLIDDILYIKSENVYVDIFTKDKSTPYTLTVGLGEFRSHAQYPKLVQSHRSYIVNIDYVTHFTRAKVTLAGKVEIPISKSWLDSFLNALMVIRKKWSEM